MNLWQAFKMAFKSIGGNKGRSFLTMLGIIIGVASVMTIVSILQGMTTKAMQYYEAMGSNKITISASLNSGRSLFDDLYSYCLQMDDVVLGVTPQGNLGDVVIKQGAKRSDTMEYQPNIYVGSDQYALCNNFQIQRGRDLTKFDVDEYQNVCVMGAYAARLFFDLTEPVGQNLMVNGIPFTVVGVYKEKDKESGGWSMDNMILFPYTATRMLHQSSNISEFVVKAKDSQTTKEAIARITGFLTGIIGDPNDPQNQKGFFRVYSEDSWRAQDNEYANMLSLVLGGIAGISLLVGGIGIMNIMLVTVTERTREIGIRRAIGAKRKSIVAQFLIEAGMICGIGGLFGVLLGTGLTLIGTKLLVKMMIWPSMLITLGAVLFSVILGIIFGLYPAVKASGLQPVVALRAE